MYLCIRVRFTAMPNANGRLPEWLGIGLQNRGQQFESATDLKSYLKGWLFLVEK